jgi:hypothetical protein
MSFYLESCIWPDAYFAMDPTANVYEILCRFRKKQSATETLAIIRQAFGEESLSRTLVFEWHARVRADRKSETGGEQSQEHPHTFL